MSETRARSDHPADRLPEHARGAASEAEARAIERHVAACGRCRDELELLRTLAGSSAVTMTAEERERAFEAFQRRRRAVPAPGAQSRDWRSAAWKVAAAIALVLTGAGVWRIAEIGGAGAEGRAWDPQAAIEGWERDLADLRPDPGAVRLALGVGGYEGTELSGPWETDVAPVDPGELRVPWEEER